MNARATNLKICVALAVAASLSALPQARAAEYPDKPINVVVPLAPGGVADILARAIGHRLTEEWKQPVVVENKTGANTQVGARHVAKSYPDGFTLLLTPDYSVTVNPFLYKQSEAVSTLTPVTGIASAPMALVVNPEVPARDVKGLVAWAKANPGKLNYGSPGVGSTSHLGMELFQSLAGVKFNSVSYRGAAPAVTDLIAGHIDAMFIALGLVTGAAKNEKLRILGIGNPSRLAQFPDIPAIAEAVPEFETIIWFGLFAPQGTSPDIVKKLNVTVQRILAEPDFDEKYLTGNSYMRMSGTSAAFAKIIERDAAKWENVIRDAAITLPK